MRASTTVVDEDKKIELPARYLVIHVGTRGTDMRQYEFVGYSAQRKTQNDFTEVVANVGDKFRTFRARGEGKRLYDSYAGLRQN